MTSSEAGFRNGIIVGLFIGFTLLSLIVLLAAGNENKYKKILQECESSLPRNQHCKLVGVVDNEAR